MFRCWLCIEIVKLCKPVLFRTIGLGGNRRDYFESIHDVWELFRAIVAQRKQRELNPRLSMLRCCLRRGPP